MKKILAFTVLGLVLTAPAAFADHHGDDRSGKGGMFERHDTNKDGKVSKEEFMNSHEEKFKKMDADSDGYVSKEEAMKVREEMKEKWQERRGDRAGKEHHMREHGDEGAPAE